MVPPLLQRSINRKEEPQGVVSKKCFHSIGTKQKENGEVKAKLLNKRHSEQVPWLYYLDEVRLFSHGFNLLVSEETDSSHTEH